MSVETWDIKKQKEILKVIFDHARFQVIYLGCQKEPHTNEYPLSTEQDKDVIRLIEHLSEKLGI